MAELRLCERRKALLAAGGNVLVLGGPGSGKTTIALAKASAEIANDALASGQKILFLSFARATVTRIVQEARVRVSDEQRRSLEVNTYHGFAWEFIRTHAYLITDHRMLRLLAPPEAAGRMAGIARPNRQAELRRLLVQEGLLGFDLFAGLAADLLEQSPRLCRIMADCYPLIIMDEFQDTNSDEWRMITALGGHSRLIALADADQRIYEFRGADPARIQQFIEKFKPNIFDFGNENNRSDGTDITMFGNDVLTGANIGRAYQNVTVHPYRYYADRQLDPVKFATLAARQRLLRGDKADWSLAVLVKSRDMMLKVSSLLGSSANDLPEVTHDVLIDPEGPALAAILIGGLLEGATTREALKRNLLADLNGHIRGRNGGDITQHDLALVQALTSYGEDGRIRGKTRVALAQQIDAIVEQRMRHDFTGDPEVDWLVVRQFVDGASHEKLLNVSADARFIRLLNRGTVLRERLAERWRNRGEYNGARTIVSDALLQEHFSASTRVWNGVTVMTVHKSKGKEFDEVIIFEGSRTGRLLRDGADDRETAQARLALRVAVTRARSRVMVLTPSWAACPLLRR